MIFTALAGRCLAQSAMAVARPLQAGDLAESRHKLWIVGRDTSQLQPAQINRAVVETVAENTVDGIIAPLFSCSSAARRWPWPIKRSTPSIPWSAINTKIPGDRHGQRPS